MEQKTERLLKLIEHPQTIGEHLKKRQQELQISQRQLSDILEVTEETITSWYYNRTHPPIGKYATIVSFLGYDPFPVDDTTLGGRIKKFRFKHGLSFRKLSMLTGFDPGSLANWENGVNIPCRTKLKKLKEFIA